MPVIRMRLLCLAFVLVAQVPPTVLADWFYPAVKIACDYKADTLVIENASAYNEAGIRKSDERNGIYVPDRNWPNGKIHRCKTRSADFRVRLWPRFAKLSAGDTFEVLVTRNGEVILQNTALDDDAWGLRPGSYITSILPIGLTPKHTTSRTAWVCAASSSLAMGCSESTR